jgi:hypothetical protein
MREGLNHLMRLLVAIALAGALGGLTAGASAQGTVPERQSASPMPAPKAVVELFTSQGCSSCPAADELLGRLAKRDDVIALSFSVDLWDYLGWHDTLANQKYTERMRDYAVARGDGAIYTPQAVVNGLVHVNGADESKITRMIEKTGRTVAPMLVPIRLSTEDGKLVIEAGASPGSTQPKDATLWLAVISKSVEVEIRRGENQGRTITYNNVVRELMPIGMWNGKAMTVRLPRDSFMRPGTERCAVLLQQGKAGPIVGAALTQF